LKKESFQNNLTHYEIWVSGIFFWSYFQRQITKFKKNYFDVNKNIQISLRLKKVIQSKKQKKVNFSIFEKVIKFGIKFSALTRSKTIFFFKIRK
jgi:hypothetical protein